jgi:nitroreductase/FMN reductase [NAD(P)H]
LFAKKGKEFPNEHLDAFFNAAVDAGIALSAFVSAAQLAGLGTCPISQIRDHVEKVNELLALPDWVVPVAGLALGYPEAKEPLSARLSLAATVHTDRYDVEAVERELDAYDARRGKDWSGDKVKQYSAVMRADFGAYVERKRFRLG